MIDCVRGERKHRIAEDFLADHQVQPGGVPDSGGPITGDGVGHHPHPGRRSQQPGQEAGVREPTRSKEPDAVNVRVPGAGQLDDGFPGRSVGCCRGDVDDPRRLRGCRRGSG